MLNIEHVAQCSLHSELISIEQSDKWGLLPLSHLNSDNTDPAVELGVDAGQLVLSVEERTDSWVKDAPNKHSD